MRRLVIGLGTGRCGTVSLSRLLNAQPDAQVRHELRPYLPWAVDEALLARKLDIDPETALRRGTAKFERRFRSVERMLGAESRSPKDASLDEMETLWQRSKSDG